MGWCWLYWKVKLLRLYVWKCFNPSRANPTKWSNTLKWRVRKLLTNFWGLFDLFAELALKGFRLIRENIILFFLWSNFRKLCRVRIQLEKPFQNHKINDHVPSVFLIDYDHVFPNWASLENLCKNNAFGISPGLSFSWGCYRQIIENCTWKCLTQSPFFNVCIFLRMPLTGEIKG